MQFLVKLVIFLCFTVNYSRQQDEKESNIKILCTKTFCEDYQLKPGCPQIPKACQIQNSTHNGVFLPYPGPCNCCKYCLENLDRGETCVIGSPDSPPPNLVCSAGLYCNNVTSVCEDSPTECMKARADYEDRKANGNLGSLELKPECDREGNYAPLKCIPGEICFCVDKNGNRIFGELPYTQQASDITKCECSRSVVTINEILQEDNYSLKRPRCMADGNYDRLQCINNVTCTCVDAADGKPTNPSKKPVFVGKTSDLPCFDKNIHVDAIFYKPCQKELLDALELIQIYKDEGYDQILGIDTPNCQLDGIYAPIQQNIMQKYCVDPKGKILNDYIVEIKPENDALLKTMNCNCARSQLIVKGPEKPECCLNGNYKRMQCRRGKCRCVDKNGMQISKEFVPGEGKPKCNANECT